MIGSAKEFEAVVGVFAAAECAGEWVVVRECLREGGRDNVEVVVVVVGGGCGGVSAEVADG